MQGKALCLVNPKAKSGAQGVDRLRGLFELHGVSAEIRSPESQEEARRLIRDESDDYDIVIVGGGDGTLSDLAGAIVESGKPLGILAMGTANDLARSLAIPTDLEEAMAVIAEGRRGRLDVGLLERPGGADRLFLNVATLGLGADVARYHKGPRKRWLGVLAYPLAWWDAWRATRPFRLTLTLDGEKRQCRCMQLAIGCGRHYGGGLTLAEGASHFDGLLHLYYVKPQPLTRWLLLLPALFLGRLGRKREAVTWSGLEARIEARRTRPINLDGELAAETPGVFKLRPAALEVFLPASTLAVADEVGGRAIAESRQELEKHEDPQG